jgi:hypothetical protein
MYFSWLVILFTIFKTKKELNMFNEVKFKNNNNFKISSLNDFDKLYHYYLLEIVIFYNQCKL